MCQHHYCNHGGRFSLIVLLIWIVGLSSFLFFHSCVRPHQIEGLRDVPAPALEEARQEAVNDGVFEVGDWPSDEWWRQLNDEQLDGLVVKGLALNPTLERADAVVRAYQARAYEVRSALFPHIAFDTDITRYRASKNGIFGAIPAPPTAPFPFSYTQTEFNFNARYEVDWWGKRCQAFRAAIGEVQARLAEAAQARLILSVAIAQSYYQVQEDIDLQAIEEAFVANRENEFRLIQERFHNRLESDLNVQQSERDLIEARVQLLKRNQSLAIRRQALNALVAGNFDEAVAPVSLECLSMQPFVLPETLPMDLLSHRPDITAQLWYLESASRRIDVARLEFYPNLNLLALVGQQTLHFGTLFHRHSIYGQAGPALHLPIFEGGLLIANLKEQQEEYRIAAADYEDLLIHAVKDVLIDIADVTGWKARLTENEKRAASAKISYQLAEKRLQRRINSRIELLAVERDWLSARKAVVEAKAELLLSWLDLIQSLGGGYARIDGNCSK